MIHTITEISITKRGRYALFLDGEFLFSVDEETFTLRALRTGMQLDDEQLSSLYEDTQLKGAKEKALSLLSYKDYTVKMMVERLCEHFDEDAALSAAKRMEELGLINDLNYAQRLSRDLVHLKHYSLRRVTLELKKRGVDDDTIQQALEQFDSYDFLEEIETVLQKKYRKDLASPKGQTRAINGLTRLGYSYQDIRRAIRHILEEEAQ